MVASQHQTSPALIVDADADLAAAASAAVWGGIANAGQSCIALVSVNSVFSFAMVPSVPFGGVGDSGFGRIHGADGLREFCYAHAVVRQRFRPPMPLMSFARRPKHEEQLGRIIALVHGRK